MCSGWKRFNYHIITTTAPAPAAVTTTTATRMMFLHSRPLYHETQEWNNQSLEYFDGGVQSGETAVE